VRMLAAKLTAVIGSISQFVQCMLSSVRQRATTLRMLIHGMTKKGIQRWMGRMVK